MRYVIRADASKSIGAGHVMRSTAIAEELIARGSEVVFVGQISDLPWVENRIAALGFSTICKNTDEFISNNESDILILDSYEIPQYDQFIAPAKWLHIVSIVDEQTPNYFCALRIHPGLDASWVGDSAVPIIAGPLFIPFRKSLSRVTAEANYDHRALRVAVVAGGSDPYELAIAISKILAKFSEALEVLVFSNSVFEETLDSRFQFIEIGPRLDELTQNVDLVLTSSSTSSLEFIARGLCVGVACAVNNQQQNYLSLGQFGTAAQIGFRNSSNEWELDSDLIYDLIRSSELRAKLISNSVGLVDFLGAHRIVDVLQNL